MHWLQCQRHEVQRQKAYIAFRRDLMIQNKNSHRLGSISTRWSARRTWSGRQLKRRRRLRARWLLSLLILLVLFLLVLLLLLLSKSNSGEEDVREHGGYYHYCYCYWSCYCYCYRKATQEKKTSESTVAAAAIFKRKTLGTKLNML